MMHVIWPRAGFATETRLEQKPEEEQWGSEPRKEEGNEILTKAAQTAAGTLVAC